MSRIVTLGDVCSAVSSSIAQKDLTDNDGDYPIYGASGLIKKVDFFKQEKPYIAIVKDGAGVGRTMLLPAKSSVIGTMQYILPDERIDIRFLYYLLVKLDLARYYTGATIPHIYFKDYRKENFALPPLHIQYKIADILDKTSELIAGRKKQLKKLDLLVKSRFVEMFGDPVTNPMGWMRSTIGESCHYVKDGPHVSPKYVEDGTGIPFISTRNLVGSDGIDWSTAKYISEADYEIYTKKCKPERGDILYSKGGTTGIARYVNTDIRFANWVHVAVLKFGDNLNGIFFEHMLNSDYCYRQSQLLTKGIVNRDLVLGSMKQVQFFIPPLDLQTRFADFVRQADKSKFEIQQGLEKLELQYNALMQQYFSEGVS